MAKVHAHSLAHKLWKSSRKPTYYTYTSISVQISFASPHSKTVGVHNVLQPLQFPSDARGSYEKAADDLGRLEFCPAFRYPVKLTDRNIRSHGFTGA